MDTQPSGDPAAHRAEQRQRRRWLSDAVRPGRSRIRLAIALLAADTAGAIGFAVALGGIVAAAAAGAAIAQWVVLGLAAVAVRGLATRGSALAALAASATVQRHVREAGCRAMLLRRHPSRSEEDTLGNTMLALTAAVDSLDGYVTRVVPARQAMAPAVLLVLAAAAGGSWFTALLLAGTLLPFVVIMVLAGGAAADAARERFDALARLTGLFADRVRRLPVILAARAERPQTERLAAAAAGLHAGTMRVLRLAFLSSAALEFFAALSVALVAVYCGFALLHMLPFAPPERLTVGRAVFALVLAPELFAPMRRSAAAYHEQRAAEAAANRLMQLDEPVPTRPAPTALPTTLPAAPAAAPPAGTPPRLRFEDVGIRYPGEDRPAVDGFNLDIRPGEMVALLGPSGSGKSSVIHLLLGLAPLASGEVWIDDEALTGRGDVAALASWMGQNSFLVASSVEQNIALSRRNARRTDIAAAAVAAGLDRSGGRTVDGVLERMLDDRGGGLSGGERRRVMLARALLKPAPLLLLDEPTAHLDAEAERALIATIRAAAQGRTTLVATHSSALAAAADRIVQLQAP